MLGFAFGMFRAWRGENEVEVSCGTASRLSVLPYLRCLFLRGSSASKEHMCLDLDDRISGMIMVMMTKFGQGVDFDDVVENEAAS